MNEPKPFASLSPSLLARKGAARPAMRPQLQPLAFDEDRNSAYGFHGRQQFQDDLGWNDMGEDLDRPAPAAVQTAPVEQVVVPITASLTPMGVEPPVERAAMQQAATPSAAALVKPAPEVLRQLDALAETLGKASRRKRGTALKEGRKAAFTLRVDSERHLRLRLACAMQNCSAQSLLTEALDRVLSDLPGLDEIAARMKRH